MGRGITDGEQSLPTDRATLGGKAEHNARDGNYGCNDCEQVAALPNGPTGDRQANKHGCKEQQTPPSSQLLCGWIAHGARSRLTIDSPPTSEGVKLIPVG
jgi:hypothetical protein